MEGTSSSAGSTSAASSAACRSIVSARKIANRLRAELVEQAEHPLPLAGEQRS